MRLVTYDCEVFEHDWLVVFKDKQSGKYTCIWNDNEALADFLSDDCIYVGFNSKHYDQYIIKAIVYGYSPQEVKKVNDYIIGGGQGWQCPMLDYFFRFNNVDIRDDTQQGLSLKAIEGHLGMPIKESSVPFDIDRPLTDEEREETVFYCKHDVDSTEKLIDLRKDYLENKINLGKLAGINEVKAMGMTNAKLTAAMLQAKKKQHNDERCYEYPSNLKKEYIPQEVFDFFDRIHDDSLSDDEVFKGKLNIMIGECPVTLGFGGIHGAIPNFIWVESHQRGIWNKDVGSYYPHLCTINGYTSRNIPSPKLYEDVLDRRMKAKAEGNMKVANPLKLVCNTTYGCLLNKYNDLYDPLMGRSVCISGQLYLLELAEHCYQEIKGLRIVQLNTDGIMVECDKKDYKKLNDICDEWQQRTGFELEEDTVIKIVQKDVNNYIEVQQGGKPKAKGGYLVKGVSTKGAFNVNNNCVIVATALKQYFLYGIPVEETVNNCDDIFQFQMIAKAGAKYKEAYHLVNGMKVPVQKVNRVYATSDERYGKLYKVKAEDSSEAKIDSLPEHCFIDNNNELSIEQIDRDFYIAMAKKRINDFKGIEPEKKGKKKMTTTTKKTTTTKPGNVYQKLIQARLTFMEGGVEKTGKNMFMSFMYFELEDIVPRATKIFNDIGLLPVVKFEDGQAKMDVINTDNPDEVVTFTAPFDKIEPIISNNKGTKATNSMQALGASITYMRRYLYMIALDICEADEIDGHLGEESTPKTVAAKPVQKKIPVTPQQREQVKEHLTAPAEKASDLQIRGLKNVLKKLREADPSKEDFIIKLGVETNSFKNISKTDCEAVIKRVNEMLGA